MLLACHTFAPRKPRLCFAVGYPTKFSASVSKLSLSLPVNVSVANPNYYGLHLQQTTINLVYLHPVLSKTRMPVVLSTVTAPSIQVTAKGNSTLSFTAVMHSNPNTVSSDAAILKDCAAHGLTLLYVNATVTVLSWFHIAVPNQLIATKCSVSAFSLAKLVPDSQAQKTVFCTT